MSLPPPSLTHSYTNCKNKRAELQEALVNRELMDRKEDELNILCSDGVALRTASAVALLTVIIQRTCFA